MDETEMVKRVAEAMKEFASKPLGNLERGLDPVLVTCLGDGWLYLARAAIKSMREPTGQMVWKGRDPIPEFDYGVTSPGCVAIEVWEKMIDEALT